MTQLDEAVSFGYSAAASEVEESAADGCTWCQLILSLKGDAEEVSLGGGHSPLLELPIRFGSGLKGESFTPPGNNRFGLWINGATYYLTAFTTGDDPVSELVTARELENDINSAKVFEQIQKWLKDCAHHDSCERQMLHGLPSRVIEVSPEHDPGTPRLLATHGLVDNYVALSYCWGPNQTCFTTKRNLNAHLQRLDMNTLSRTIQDAILVTRRMNIKYLWVDAMCIIQDSEEDKIIELAAMCRIYQQAFITIVAANAENANQGFLSCREPPAPATRVPFWTQDGRLGTVSLRLEGWYDDESEPVNTRAWTLQERLLSPRLLIYATHTLQYQCQQHTVNLGDSINFSFGGGAWRLPSFSNLSSGNRVSEWDVQSAGRTWGYIISLYSQRRLSYIEDKLTALAGIAEAFSSQIQVEYLAGLWSGELLPRLLLWMTDQTTDYSPCAIYTAPSWSWAALKSAVSFTTFYVHHAYEWYDVDDVAAKIALQSTALPFGRVTAGHLRLTAHVRQGLFQPPQYILWDRSVAHPEADDTLDSAMYASLDDGTMRGGRVICLATTRRTYPSSEKDITSMIAVSSVFSPVNVGDDATFSAIDGLIIAPIGDDGFYRRIGCFRGADENEFRNWPRQTLTLV
ncbi:HET-domain-containing protein [Glonium stellatum]|uniref:HET-domain-containing protein n=1 Tax=Glonium stellatum TaxID=574774 RepID=A0A8E2F5H5_9PEZI|nr:HET-domain-containing protein [Glonium stellatum]